MNKLYLLFITLVYSVNIAASEYQSPEAFLNEVFSGEPPKPQTLWVSKDLKPAVTDILQHKPGFMRTRYWQEGKKTTWILNEVGKTKPITVGIVVENSKIDQVKVLAFRESRGWEVKHSFFTDQFIQAGLDDDHTLDKPIDGISGATLSVRALTKLSRLALFFDQQVQK